MRWYEAYPILALNGIDSLCARDLTAGILVMGMTGGGKTSLANTILRGFVRSGMGGCITTAKPDDVENIRRICAEEGRLDSLIVWDGKNGGFNFLTWILSQQGPDGVENCIEFLMRVLEAKQASAAIPSSNSEQFWTDTKLQMLRAMVPILHAAEGTVRIESVVRFARSAPVSRQQMTDSAWQANAFFFAMITRAAERLDEATGRNCAAYWADDWVNLDARTRGNILISLTTALDPLNQGWLRRAFCEGTTLVPELCFDGAIIVLDMPALTRNEEGIFAQQTFVLAFQRAVLFRNALPQRYRERPVFLFIDEFPLFCNSQYASYLSTCRSSRCCTVLMAQSLPALVSRMQGPNAEERAQALIANTAVKVWAANNCTSTNRWAADTIGRTLQTRNNYSRNEGHNRSSGMNMGEGTNQGRSSQSGGSSSSGKGGGSSGSSWSSGSSSGASDNWGRNQGLGTNHGQSWGENEVLEYAVEPGDFGRILKTGGPANGYRVSALLYQAGRTFSSGTNTLYVEFTQK